MSTQSRKTKSSEEQIPQAPSEEDFVGLIKYISEREKGLSRYSDKLRQNLQRIFDVFGSAHYCQICDEVEEHSKHIKYRSEQGYLRREQTETINGITVMHPANADYSHPFKPKIAISINIEDSEIFATTPRDDLNAEYYRLATRDLALVIMGSTSNEQDITGMCCWFTKPDAYRATPSREELKQLLKSGRLPKFLALVAKKLAEAEAEYGVVSAIAEKMAKAVETADPVNP